MNPDNGIKLSVGALVLYCCIAAYCMIVGDHNHALMFLCGAIIWVASIFIWHRVKKDESQS